MDQVSLRKLVGLLLAGVLVLGVAATAARAADPVPSESSEPADQNWGSVLWPNRAHFNGYAQSFTASATGEMTKVELIFSAFEKTPDLIPVEVREGDGAEGPILATGWLDQTTMPIYESAWVYEWVPVELTPSVAVVDGQQYTIVVGPLNPTLDSQTPALIWWGTLDEYSRGTGYVHDYDGGADGWAPFLSQPGRDLGFRTFVAGPEPSFEESAEASVAPTPNPTPNPSPTPNPDDQNGDGINDAIASGPDAFDTGTGTSGAIIDRAGNVVTVAPDPGGVRIAVTGSGTDPARLTVCGFTLHLLPGSEVVVACGSITAEVVAGSAEIVLGGGITVVMLTVGDIGFVEEQPDGSFEVASLSATPIEVVVDGIPTVVQDEPLSVQAWNFVGFTPPVDAAPVLNVTKAGAVVPLKFRLLDGSGAPVLDLTTAQLSVTALDCGEGSTSDQLEQTAASSSGLQNLGNGYYQVNWKTAKAYANSCRSLSLDIGDGVEHTALFRFTK